MLQTFNTDINDAAYNTNAPFTCDCALTVSGMRLPELAFLSIRIYCGVDVLPPVRLSSIQSDRQHDDRCRVVFADANGREVGSFTAMPHNNVQYLSTFITDASGVIRGHVCYEKAAAALLRRMAELEGGTATTEVTDFILLPQCHVSIPVLPTSAISINGTVFTGDVHLKCYQLMHTDIDNGTVSISVVGTYTERQSNDMLCTLVVGASSFQIEGGHIFIKTDATSNLRVLSNAERISLVGVQNV